ncbi:hypothetical protein J4Q44_G00337850 [Coregonus suidteri]|uniref:Uncharacterized protein n=1 Tax=Coregonus suidteri TaxID=861788 RepID=A0AAN8KP30_9TELE
MDENGWALPRATEDHHVECDAELTEQHAGLITKVEEPSSKCNNRPSPTLPLDQQDGEEPGPSTNSTRLWRGNLKVLTVLDQRFRSPNLALHGPETGDGTEEWTQTKDPPRYSQPCWMQLNNKLRKRKSIGLSCSIQRTAIHVVV